MIHVLIDARVRANQGGVQQVLEGLIQGFGQVVADDVRFTLLVEPGHDAWLRPHLTPAMTPLEGPPRTSGAARTGARAFLRGRFGHLLGARSVRTPPMPEVVRKLNPDVVHFVHQQAFASERPYVYTIHDFQHEYLPENFSRRELLARRVLLRRHAGNAARVICISEHCRKDTLQFTGIPAEKTTVVYNAAVQRPATKHPPERAAELLPDLAQGEAFLLFPAQTYPHKNHLKLIEAAETLLNEDRECPRIVCTGRHNAHFQTVIAPRLARSPAAERFLFPGFVSVEQMEALMRRARGLIFPSRFEGFGIPIVEAFERGIPVACSDATCLPEVAGGAAYLFDCNDAVEMGRAMSFLHQDSPARNDAIERGHARARDFSWRSSAQACLSIYREIAASKLTAH
jgi:glycosyltransferase involved in cell wall biosynthesis